MKPFLPDLGELRAAAEKLSDEDLKTAIRGADRLADELRGEQQRRKDAAQPFQVGEIIEWRESLQAEWRRAVIRQLPRSYRDYRISLLRKDGRWSQQLRYANPEVWTGGATEPGMRALDPRQFDPEIRSAAEGDAERIV